MSLLRAKSRLRRLRSVHACGRSAVGIFFCTRCQRRLPHQSEDWCAMAWGGGAQWESDIAPFFPFSLDLWGRIGYNEENFNRRNEA